jgi:hypothetical protein
MDGDSRPIGGAPDVGADEYGVPPPAAVTDLRVVEVVTRTGTLTVTLRWTPPVDAVTTTLRYSDTLISEAAWESGVILTDTLPGAIGVHTATVPLGDATWYFALKTEGVGGMSDVSNNVLWPRHAVYLPGVLRGD